MVISEQRRSTATLGSATVQELRDRLHGVVVTPDDTDYDEVRAVFNAMIDRRPALIARCVDVHDVVQSVRFARGNGLLVSVRGGGHSVAGHAVCDDGLMIDLSLMKGVEVDVERQVAIVQPGVKLGELIEETEKFGFVTPTGTASDTGVAGLTLGGGYGWLAGKYGMAADNLVAAEVVTADGRVLRASADEHPDLYWALRGGSGNFGIVTSFELKLYPLTQVLGGMLLHPIERAGEVLRFYRDIAASAPDELTTYAALITAPTGDKMVAIALCYCGPIEEGEKVIAPTRAFGPPVVDMVQPMPYSVMNSLLDEANPPGMHNYWKWNGLRELTDEVIDIAIAFALRAPSPRSVILIDQLHGAGSRIDPTTIAFPHRGAPHGLVALAMWEDPSDSDANIAWARDLAAAGEPFATGGAYVNGGAEIGTHAAFGVNYARLAEIKRRYDPTNFFRCNQNIEPAK